MPTGRCNLTLRNYSVCNFAIILNRITFSTTVNSTASSDYVAIATIAEVLQTPRFLNIVKQSISQPHRRRLVIQIGAYDG